MFFLTEVVMESFNLQENNWKDVRKQKYKIANVPKMRQE